MDAADPGAQARRAAQIVGDAWRVQSRLLSGYLDLAREVAGGRRPVGEVGRDYVRTVREQAAAYWRSSTELGINYLSGLAELGRAANERVLADLTRGPMPGNGQGAAPRATLVLRGPVGGAATGSLLLTNRYDRPSTARFEAGEFTDHASGRTFPAAVLVDPPAVRIEPRSEASVSLSVPLADAPFEAGRTYRSVVLIDGADRLELGLEVNVEDVQEGAGEPTDDPGTPPG